MVHDIANGIDDLGDAVSQEVGEASCNYVTRDGLYKLSLGDKNK